MEVNAHSLFSKWFSESGKLVCTIIVTCCNCSMLAILYIGFVLIFQFLIKMHVSSIFLPCNEFVHDIDGKMNQYRLMTSACSLVNLSCSFSL